MTRWLPDHASARDGQAARLAWISTLSPQARAGVLRSGRPVSPARPRPGRRSALTTATRDFPMSVDTGSAQDRNSEELVHRWAWRTEHGRRRRRRSGLPYGRLRTRLLSQQTGAKYILNVNIIVRQLSIDIVRHTSYDLVMLSSRGEPTPRQATGATDNRRRARDQMIVVRILGPLAAERSGTLLDIGPLR